MSRCDELGVCQARGCTGCPGLLHQDNSDGSAAQVPPTRGERVVLVVCVVAWAVTAAFTVLAVARAVGVA